jgi:hypothetical protein
MARINNCSIGIGALLLLSCLHVGGQTQDIELQRSQELDPVGIQRAYIDHQGTVYALEETFHRIAVFDSNGMFKGQIGSIGQHRGEFYYPDDMAEAANGDLYVLEPDDRRVQATSTSGHFFLEFPIRHQANAIVVNSKRHVLLADPYERGLISEYDEHGVFLKSFGDKLSFSQVYGPQHRQLDRQYIHGINRVLLAVGRQDEVFVAFIGAPIIREYAPSGTLRHEWTYPDQLAQSITHQISNTLTVPTSEKFAEDGLAIPSFANGIAYDADRQGLWVAVNWQSGHLLWVDPRQGKVKEDRLFQNPQMHLGRLTAPSGQGDLLALTWGWGRETTLLYILK